MTTYTFTDDCGTREEYESDTDAEAISAFHQWVEGGIYDGNEVALWQDDRLVASFTTPRI